MGDDKDEHVEDDHDEVILEEEDEKEDRDDGDGGDEEKGEKEANKRGTCKVGDHVKCPNSDTSCAGDQCCPDRSTCPSASAKLVSWGLQSDGGVGCDKPKAEDCTGLH